MTLTYEQRRQLETQRFQAAWEAKTKLTAAFRQLRKEGIIAKQSFMCCGTCAGSQIATDITKALDDGKTRPLGCVYYTKQGGFFDGHPEARFTKVRKLYLQFGDVETTKHGVIGIGTVEVGKRVCKALEAAGLAYEWDGTADKTIVVDPCPDLWEPKKPEPKKNVKSLWERIGEAP